MVIGTFQCFYITHTSHAYITLGYVISGGLANASCSGVDVFPLKWGRRLTCSGERAVFRDGEQTVGEKSLCATDGPSAAHRVRENKRRCARSPDTKPGHAEIMGPAQWVANKRAALIILPHLIFTAHLKSQSGIWQILLKNASERGHF